MAVLGVTDVELGRRLGISRQAAHARRTGRTAMTAVDMMEVAQVLDIEPALFFGLPHEALRWLAEHRAEQLDDMGNDQRRHNGEQNDPSSLSSKGSRLRRLARQHNEWSYKLGVSATAA